MKDFDTTGDVPVSTGGKMVVDEVVVIAKKNVDEELLKIISDDSFDRPGDIHVSANGSEELHEAITRQRAELLKLAERMPRVSFFKRLLRLLFPLVEEGKRVRT